MEFRIQGFRNFYSTFDKIELRLFFIICKKVGHFSDTKMINESRSYSYSISSHETITHSVYHFGMQIQTTIKMQYHRNIKL